MRLGKLKLQTMGK